MRIELGNPSPVLTEEDTPFDFPSVTVWEIDNDDPENFPDDHHCYAQVQDSGLTGDELRLHLADSAFFDESGMQTHLPGHEPVLSAIMAWFAHATRGTRPTWVWASDAETGRILSEFFRCPLGRPADLEQTHWTYYDGTSFPPGQAPIDGVPYGSIPDVQANITTDGRDMQAKIFGTGSGLSGTGTTAPTGTTITLDDQTAPGSTSKWNGQMIVCGGVYGNVVSNTNATPPVVTVDRWNSLTAPGASGASGTPAAGKYTISQTGAPAQIMGLSTSTTALAAPSTNTSLPSEITTAGGGLIRQICPIAHTAGAATTTLTPVYTANGSDSLPAIIGSIGTFNSMVTGDTTKTMFFNTLLGTTATLSAIGDQLTITQTITGT